MLNLFNKKLASVEPQKPQKQGSALLYVLAVIGLFKGVVFIVECVPKIIEWFTLRF